MTTIWPRATVTSRPFWLGLERGELWLQRCHGCGETVFYPRLVCPRCHRRSLAWSVRPASGRIITHTTVHMAPPAFQPWAPYHLGIGDFDGARLLGVIAGVPAVGVPIEIVPSSRAPEALAGMPTPYVFTVALEGSEQRAAEGNDPHEEESDA